MLETGAARSVLNEALSGLKDDIAKLQSAWYKGEVASGLRHPPFPHVRGHRRRCRADLVEEAGVMELSQHRQQLTVGSHFNASLARLQNYVLVLPFERRRGRAQRGPVQLSLALECRIPGRRPDGVAVRWVRAVPHRASCPVRHLLL
eukprot:4099467-Pleurochrysis_carterae.AAC.1